MIPEIVTSLELLDSPCIKCGKKRPVDDLEIVNPGECESPTRWRCRNVCAHAPPRMPKPWDRIIYQYNRSDYNNKTHAWEYQQVQTIAMVVALTETPGIVDIVYYPPNGGSPVGCRRVKFAADKILWTWSFEG